MTDPILLSTFDNIHLTDLQNLANKYKSKSINDLNKIFIGRCKPEDRENPQCKYDVDLLTNVVYNIARIPFKKAPPPPPPSKPATLDYSKLPPKLRAKILQQKQLQAPPLQQLGQKPSNPILPGEIDLKKIKPIKSDILPISAKLETLIQKITRDKTSALEQKAPELMKTQLQIVKKEMNEYIKLLSNSYNDINKYSPKLLPKYKQLNSEYIILNKYIDTYENFLNSLIKIKDLAPKLAANQTKKSILNDSIREYVKLITINNSLPGQYRIMGYIDKSPLEILYSIKPFMDSKDVQQLHKKYKITTS